MEASISLLAEVGPQPSHIQTMRLWGRIPHEESKVIKVSATEEPQD